MNSVQWDKLPKKLTSNLNDPQKQVIQYYYIKHHKKDKEDKRRVLSDLRAALSDEAFKAPVLITEIDGYLDVDKYERIEVIRLYALVIDTLYCLFWNTHRIPREFLHLY